MSGDPALAPLLERLARQRGIGDAYHNFRGDLLQISLHTKTAILAAMGCPTTDAGAIEHELRTGEARYMGELLPPVVVLSPGRTGVTVAVAADALDRTIGWQIEVDGGQQMQGEVHAGSLQEHERREVDGRWLTRRELPLPAELPHGYHQLQLTLDGDAPARRTLIVAPGTCFEPDAIRSGRRLWGVSVQLYTLRSDSNWGIGDFADLEYVMRACAEQGAAFVGLNPLHALFPAEPRRFSPYSPSSRLFLNVLYVAVEKLPEYARSERARAHVGATVFQAELSRLRSTPVVDYAGVTRAKLPVLRMLHEQFKREQENGATSEGRQFHAFREERGVSLQRHALHDAIDEHLRQQDADHWGWPVWPEQLRDPASPDVQAFAVGHAAEVEFHAWLQWHADRQLGAVQALGQRLGMPIGLYGDYAVGVSPSGSETWAEQSLYCRGAGVGAPPDALALKGQDWGIPPQDPNALIAQQYRPFQKLIAANMRRFGALRLDHVMSLFRQWWVPHGLGSTDGGYVHYPLDELASVLALESERHGCLVVGENLGTVPQEVSRVMHERALYSYRVLLFEKRADGSFIPPLDYPRRAAATITTHDLPTLAGYWSGSDIELRQRLDLYPSDEVPQQVLAERNRDRGQLLAVLQSQGLEVPASDGSTSSYSAELSRAIHVFLARTTSALVVLQAEDLVGMADPVNVPGTDIEHANWQRKMSCTIEELFGSESVRALLREVNAARAR